MFVSTACYFALVTKVNVRENFLRAARFEGPVWIPCEVGIYPVIYRKHREEMDDILSRHRHLFLASKWNADEVPRQDEDWTISLI